MITRVYRLLQLAGARRMLLLVDTRNLGKQAHQELVIPLADERPAWPRRRFRR